MIAVARAVESHAVDALFLRLGGDAAADELGRLAVAAGLQLAAHLFLERRGARQHAVARGRGDLGVDVAVGAVHGEAHGADLADPVPGLAGAALPGDGLVFHGGYFFFVSFNTMTSST